MKNKKDEFDIAQIEFSNNSPTEELKKELFSKFTIDGLGKLLACSKSGEELWQFIEQNFVPKAQYQKVADLLPFSEFLQKPLKCLVDKSRLDAIEECIAVCDKEIDLIIPQIHKPENYDDKEILESYMSGIAEIGKALRAKLQQLKGK